MHESPAPATFALERQHIYTCTCIAVVFSLFSPPKINSSVELAMSFLSTVEETLPPGFRFHPSDDELICDYLVPKLDDACPMMVDIDLNKCEPWDLPETARVGNKMEWYFFSLHDRKYATGPRTNRATISGYWKATGKDRHVTRGGTLVGMRKTLVFYRGRAPRGTKTEWVMHEFRSQGRTRSRRPNNPTQSPVKEDWVLCRVFCKNTDISGRPSHDETAGSPQSHSPPVEEDIYINFEQPTETLEGFEQVPCFSSNTSHDSSLGPHLQTPMTIRSLTSLITMSSPPLIGQFGSLPELISDLNHLSPDSKVLNSTVTMSQYLSRLEGNANKGHAPNAGEGSTSGLRASAASHSGLPSTWSGFIS